MPFIKTKVSCSIAADQETELKKRFGKAISLVPGKSEDYLLLEFEDNSRMWLRGERDEPIAYIEAAFFGNESHTGYAAFTAEVTRALTQILGLKPERVYVKFEDITAWGVGGQYIDRGMFR